MKVLFIIFITLLPFSLFSKTAEPSSPPPVEQSETPPDLSKEMPQSVQKSLGFNQWTSAQKKALSQWMINWKTQTKKPEGNAVEAVLDAGHYVKLYNGQVWNVSPNAWLYTYYWKQGDLISVQESQDTLFPTALVNETQQNGIVNAEKAAGAVSDSFSKSYKISKIKNHGSLLELSDGSSWKIPSASSYLVAGWSTGEAVYIHQIEGSSPPSYQIVNGKNSRAVTGSMVQTQKKNAK